VVRRFPGLDPALAAMIDQAAAAGLPSMTELSPDEARARVRAGDALCAPGPAMRSVSELRVGAGAVPVRRYLPAMLSVSTIVVWFHGGGWITGDIGYSDAICRLIADTAQCQVISIDYRLAPENPFPAAIEDGLDVARWAAHASSNRGRSSLVLAGDSAGGNIAAVCTQQLASDADVDVVGQLLVYPVLDSDVGRPSYLRNEGVPLGAKEMTWFFDQYCPDQRQRSSALFSPMRSSKLSRLPAAVIAVAGHDTLYDEGVEYGQRLRSAGVPAELLDYPALLHGFLRYTAISSAAADAARDIARAASRLLYLGGSVGAAPGQ
jgi:acetyl esterase